MDWPTSSSGLYPKVRSTDGLAKRTTPFESTTAMTSRLFSMIERK